MGTALHEVGATHPAARGELPRRAAGFDAWLGWAPAVTVALFVLPIGAGLLGTLAPAFGYLPAIGGHAFSFAPWRALFAYPGFATSLELTLATGLAATALSLAIALTACAWLHSSRLGRRFEALLAPLLAVPHAALAIGLAFLLLPSGWIARLISPWLTGWSVPPDLLTVAHPSGWPIVLSLVIKEVPYLMLMIFGALNQVPAREQVRAAQALGYRTPTAWFKVVLPQVYPQIRLPVFAVLSFSLSVVDVALVLGPGNPPPLAVLAVRWFADPDTSRYFEAAAAAMLLFGVVAACIALWMAGERGVASLGRRWVERGNRVRLARTSRVLGAGAAGTIVVAATGAFAGLVVWSFAQLWRFPAAWPQGVTLANWVHQSASLRAPTLMTIAIGSAAMVIAVALTVACLEHEARLPATRSRRARGLPILWLVYLPLLIPQVAFMFGVQVLLVRVGLDATFSAVVWAHLVFVLPYVFLSLADPWRAFDGRYTRSALALGNAPLQAFVRVKLPILLRPLLIACAVAFAISAGQYLPTLFAGSGRVATLTTEAVTLAGGADRRVIGTWAILQAVLPWLGYVAAAVLPSIVFARRKGMQR